uniref:Alkaline ceramidase n=1 Tax=Hemiselmis tepida TaxID=464990 RepID=A0A7S0YYH2_9CRYP|mmetsp:Transcript_3213/g.8204  ORF Transcript_3213/g.8204 Transcript_3213/m.8204 type:complete len:292 (+) Transcript_3213:268-1143(+)
MGQIRFEPSGTDNTGGWWGEATSSIDWCERNYTHTVYIAEFFNTISNIGLIASGCHTIYTAIRLQFELRFIALGIGALLVGLGSAAFHCTLQYWAQMWDEVPMVWTMLVWSYCHITMEGQGSWALAAALCVYGVWWGYVHYLGAYVVLFQVHFGVLVVLGIAFLSRSVSVWCTVPILPVSSKRLASVHVQHRKLRLMGQLYVVYISAAFVIWVVDQKFCPSLHALPVNPQLHAWWHLLAGLNVHFGLHFMMALRQSIVDRALPATAWWGKWLLAWVVKTPQGWVGKLPRRD